MYPPVVWGSAGDLVIRRRAHVAQIDDGQDQDHEEDRDADGAGVAHAVVVGVVIPGQAGHIGGEARAANKYTYGQYFDTPTAKAHGILASTRSAGPTPVFRPLHKRFGSPC